MPSEDVNEKRISDLPLVTAQNVTEDTLVELSVEDQSSASGHSSYAGKLSTIIDKILNAFNFNTRLQTTNKTVFGAINEIAQGGGGGGSANLTELTQAEYDALEQAGELEEDMMYFITDGQSGNEIIDDTTTSASKVWSSDKTDSEIQAVKPTFIGYDNGATPSASEVQNTSIASGGGQSHANVVFNKTLDPGLYLGHIMIRFAANDSGFRRIYCSVNDGSNAYGLINSVTEKAVSANVETYAHLIVTLNPDVQTTYSFCAYQDSGSTLTVEGRYAFIKLL